MKKLVTVLAVLFLVGVVQAAPLSVGVNLTQASGLTNIDILPSETAGAPSYAQANWNNIDWNDFGGAATLNDDSGAATGLGISGYAGTTNGNWTGNWTTSYQYSGHNPAWMDSSLWSTPDGKLFSGGYKRARQDTNDTTDVTISNISDLGFSGAYSLVVYFSGLPGDRNWNNGTVSGSSTYYTVFGEVKIEDGSSSLLAKTDYQGFGLASPNGTVWDGTWAEQTSVLTGVDPSNPQTPATHMVFTGLTEDTLTLHVNAASGMLNPETRKGGGGIAGFQIIGEVEDAGGAIPEPATMALVVLGIGGMALLARKA